MNKLNNTSPALRTQELRSIDQPDRAFGMLKHLRTPVWVFDIDNHQIAFANAPAIALWGATSEEELCARDLSGGMSPAVAQRLSQYQQDFLLSDETFTENWTVYPNGEPVALSLLFSGYELTDGRMAMMCEVLDQMDDDPTVLRRTDALLHADVMVTMFEENGPPLYFNPASRKAVRSTKQHFCEMFVIREEHDDLMHGVFATGENRAVHRVNTSEGETWHDLSVRKCTDPATGKPAILVTAFDVSELKTARDKARYLAETDPLTNCHNRTFLHNRLDEVVQTTSTSDAGLIYFDLDRFKQINDSSGHHVGDMVLQEVSNRVRTTLGPDEVLARLGGDEFVILVRNVLSPEQLFDRAEQTRTLFDAPIKCDDVYINVSISVGAAKIDIGLEDWSDAMRCADIALYTSKLSGRDKSSVFTEEMGREATRRLQMETDLAEAIRTDQFVLHYQPRVCLTTGRVVSVEALVRWNHPELGLVPPGQFIPLCEETGMIEELGALIIEKASNEAQRWHLDGRNIGVSINVSPRQFEGAALIDVIEDVRQKPGIQTDQIEFEITESILVGDDETVTSRLGSIHSKGFRIAVDDFGTGYSNLNSISRFPLHCIKIDKSFVDQLPGSRSVIKLIATLAQEIGAIAVAEGVEDGAHVQVLRDLGCKQIQGFYFSKPVASDQLDTVIPGIEASARAMTM